jgi:hypothetical protein
MMLIIESLLVGASSQPKDKVSISCITIIHMFILRQYDLALERAMRIWDHIHFLYKKTIFQPTAVVVVNVLFI